MVPPLLKPNQLTPRRQTGWPCASTKLAPRTRRPREPAAGGIARCPATPMGLGLCSRPSRPQFREGAEARSADAR